VINIIGATRPIFKELYILQKLKTLAISLAMTLLLALSFIGLPTIVVGGSMLLMSNSADAAECTLYQTIHPNFPLTGSHLSTGKCSTCASCHAGGVYLGTPKICATCHNGNPSSQLSAQTIGRSANHPPIGTTACDACHNTTSFTASWAMNHASVSGQRCDSCHNGSYTTYGAMGKPSEHPPTTADCGTCHVTKDTSTHSNDAWSMSLADIHRGITTGCVSCHDGAHHPALGKIDYAPGHPTTSDACETCHSITAQFKCASLIDDKVIKNMMKQRFVWVSIRKKIDKV